jgi:hypothetical protein
MIEVYSPSGSYVTMGGEINTTLTTAGTYTILMRDASNAYAGEYVLSWRRVVNPCSSLPINCGQILSGSISAADEIDMYTFTVSANDWVTIRTRKTGNLNLQIEVYNPSGTRIYAGASWDTPMSPLTPGGTYTLLVRDYYYVNTGDYILYWERLNNPCNVAATLACEQVVAGSVGIGVDPPPWRIYRFTASANDKVTIRARKTSGTSFSPMIEVYSPSGSYVTMGGEVNTTLTTAGTYTILMKDVSNAYAGEYVLSWRRVVNPCSSTPINCGQVLSGTIGAADEIDVYTFTVSANDWVTIRTRKTGNLNLQIEVYNPSGTRIYAGASWDTPMTPLTAAGTYTLLVRDYYYVNTGDYILYWERLNSPCNVAATLACEQVVAGSVGIGLDPPPGGFTGLRPRPMTR